MNSEFWRLFKENTELLATQRVVSHNYPNKDVYLGFMTDDKRHGLGKLTYISQESSGKIFYSGEWKQDKRHGQGALVSDTIVQSGKWENDSFIGN